VKFSTLVSELSGLWDRLQPFKDAFYVKLDVEPPASPDAIERFTRACPKGAVPALVEGWQTHASVRFEWFLKTAGAATAGIDSRLAPNGQFMLFSPETALKEMQFLEELGGVTGDEMHLLPIGRLDPNGEFIALDVSLEEPCVVLVILDLVLTVLPLAPSLEAWYEQRIQTYFEDSTLDPSAVASPMLRTVIECLNGRRATWPPKVKHTW
jgi:hypothetical protein